MSQSQTEINQLREMARRKSMSLSQCHLCFLWYLRPDLNDPPVCHSSACQERWKSRPRWVNDKRTSLTPEERKAILENPEHVLATGPFYDGK